MKLWAKGYELDQLAESFMTGDDPILDQDLITYDCLGSMAHAKMLCKIGILSSEECAKLVQELHAIIEDQGKGYFQILPEDEDVHTAVENRLTARLESLGKKLHTARSRNDQVLLDLRLYMRDRLCHVAQAALALCQTLFQLANHTKEVPIPGRTHFQRAMPSSVGLWAAAFGESMLDNVKMLQPAYELINQCPLGSAASYGVSLSIDRLYCADLLGFQKVQNNVLYVNNSRGKFEAFVLQSLVQIMIDLSKLSTDIIIFSAPEFGYFTLPESFCPGSSLMPQKRNPCALELIRAKASTVMSYHFQILEIVKGLPSGYNRDFQETKRPLMHGFETVLASLHVMNKICLELQVNEQNCIEAFTPDLFATDYVLTLVSQGMPFRDAYRKVGQDPENVPNQNPVQNILSKNHLGSTGNLGIEQMHEILLEEKTWWIKREQNWEEKKEALIL